MQPSSKESKHFLTPKKSTFGAQFRERLSNRYSKETMRILIIPCGFAAEDIEKFQDYKSFEDPNIQEMWRMHSFESRTEYRMADYADADERGWLRDSFIDFWAQSSLFLKVEPILVKDLIKTNLRFNPQNKQMNMETLLKAMRELQGILENSEKKIASGHDQDEGVIHGVVMPGYLNSNTGQLDEVVVDQFVKGTATATKLFQMDTKNEIGGDAGTDVTPLILSRLIQRRPFWAKRSWMYTAMMSNRSLYYFPKGSLPKLRWYADQNASAGFHWPPDMKGIAALVEAHPAVVAYKAAGGQEYSGNKPGRDRLRPETEEPKIHVWNDGRTGKGHMEISTPELPHRQFDIHGIQTATASVAGRYKNNPIMYEFACKYCSSSE